jgi:hypothetical protein
LQTLCWGCVQTAILLISDSWIARITDVSHQHLAWTHSWKTALITDLTPSCSFLALFFPLQFLPLESFCFAVTLDSKKDRTDGKNLPAEGPKLSSSNSEPAGQITPNRATPWSWSNPSTLEQEQSSQGSQTALLKWWWW